MPPDEKPIVDTLTLPRRDELQGDDHSKYCLYLADLALKAARNEQARIKAQIRPHVERYKTITGLRQGRKIA